MKLPPPEERMGTMTAATPIHGMGSDGTTACDLSHKQVLPNDRLLLLEVAGMFPDPPTRRPSPSQGNWCTRKWPGMVVS